MAQLGNTRVGLGEGARIAGRLGLCAAAAALVISCLWGAAALAQTPFVADEWKFGKRQESSTLHFCIDARDPDFPIARKIGEAIAGALLLQPKEHVIGENVVGEDIGSSDVTR